MGDSRHTQNIQTNKLLVKMRNESFILWKKLNKLFSQPKKSTDTSVIYTNLFMYLYLDGGEGKQKESKRNINMGEKHHQLPRILILNPQPKLESNWQSNW